MPTADDSNAVGGDEWRKEMRSLCWHQGSGLESINAPAWCPLLPLADERTLALELCTGATSETNADKNPTPPPPPLSPHPRRREARCRWQ
mgnify:CR=1 FL=1